MKKTTLTIIAALISMYSLAQEIRFDAILGKERNLRLDMVASKFPLKSDFFMTFENNIGRMRYNVMPLNYNNWHLGMGSHILRNETLNSNELDFGPTITYRNNNGFSQTNIYVLNQKVFNKTHINFGNLETDILSWYQNGGNFLIRPGITFWKDYDKFKGGLGLEAYLSNINNKINSGIGLRGSFKIK
jgi:hypothetical protein